MEAVEILGKVVGEIEKLEFSGSTIMALDHGGPWLKDRHVIERLEFEEALE